MDIHYIWNIIMVILLLDSTLGEAPHECDRHCDGNSMTCEYHFTLETYYTMAMGCADCPFTATDCDRPQCVPGDGNRRVMMMVNRKLPGPQIRVCYNDTVVVHVHNYLDGGAGTSIHWHGIHQRGTPYMDGNNMVTQCPITPGSTFLYQFKADPFGTMFWHSHIVPQRADGLFGSFIVAAPPSDDPLYYMYDHDCATPSGDCEHVVLLGEWFDTSAMERYQHYLRYDIDSVLPSSGLINGRNGLQVISDPEDPARTGKTPWEIFQVTQGKRYRFRFISATSSRCPYKVSIEGHPLTLIAADGRPVQTVEVNSFIIASGERYDFVVDTGLGTAVNNYWMRALPFLDCFIMNAFAYAIIRYDGAIDQEPTSDKNTDDTSGKLLNPLSYIASPFPAASHGEGQDIPYAELNSVPEEYFTDEIVDVKIYLGMTIRFNDPGRFDEPLSTESLRRDIIFQKSRALLVINNITMFLPSSPVLSQPEQVPEASWCNENKNDTNQCFFDRCSCFHAIKVGLNQVIELIVIDEGPLVNLGHPMHLHGYSFRVVGYGRFGDATNKELVKRADEAGKLPRNLVNPSYRDNVMVPDGGYVILRFKADNPGVWAFHCHREYHIMAAQVMEIQVGEQPDFPPVPHGFPTCGSFDPRQSSTTTTTPKPWWEKNKAAHIYSAILLYTQVLLLSVMKCFT